MSSRPVRPARSTDAGDVLDQHPVGCLRLDAPDDERCRHVAVAEPGKPYEIGCLNDRRDWDAIEAMVPDEFFGMSNSELRPHYVELQMADDGYKAAIEYCRSVGAID